MYSCDELLIPLESYTAQHIVHVLCVTLQQDCLLYKPVQWRNWTTALLQAKRGRDIGKNNTGNLQRQSRVQGRSLFKTHFVCIVKKYSAGLSPLLDLPCFHSPPPTPPLFWSSLVVFAFLSSLLELKKELNLESWEYNFIPSKQQSKAN